MDIFCCLCNFRMFFLSALCVCVCVAQLCPSLTVGDDKSAITLLVVSQYIMYLSSLAEVFAFSFTLIFRILMMKSLTNCGFLYICPAWCSLCFLDPRLMSLISFGKFSVISFSDILLHFLFPFHLRFQFFIYWTIMYFYYCPIDLGHSVLVFHLYFSFIFWFQ